MGGGKPVHRLSQGILRLLHLVRGVADASGHPSATDPPASWRYGILRRDRVCPEGLAAEGLPPHTFGFIYLPALIGVAGMSYLTAPLGARLAHLLPVSRLKKLFACLLIANGLKMLSGLL